MSESNDRERRVDEAVAWYYRQVEAGTTPEPDTFLARFPDVRDDLVSFLADKAAFERAAQPADVDRTVTLDQPTPRPASLERVRYFGDYELLVEIARGGMGVVYKARQVSLNREVALKMILSGQLASEADVLRFRQEAEAAANLDHPNILPIYEVGEHDGRQYFSMKLVSGGSLAQLLTESPRTNVRGNCDLLTKVCRAVHFAHQRGILHRDLKPSNVLLEADRTPYVTDFGLAKKVEGDAGLTQSGALVGTPSYMAPEQARAERHLTTGVDVYSLGAILYEMLTGRPPFRGTGVMDTVLQVLERDPADPRTVNPKVDRDLSVIALKCLSKEPAKRYESAAALADDLERWRRGEPIVARAAGPAERFVKWTRRNPVATLFTAAILILLVSGLSIVTRLYLLSEHYRIDAEGQRDEARIRLARQYAEKAAAAADVGNPLAGLPWLVEALRVTDGKPEAEAHRVHLAALLTQAPGLVHYSPTATCVSLHPDGKRVAIGEKDGVDLVPLGSDEPIVPRIKLSVSPSTAVFSPDGKRLLIAGGVGGAGLGPWEKTHARVFDTDTGVAVTPEARLGRDKDGATAIRFSADGSVVVALWQGAVNRDVVATEVYLYESATLKPIAKPFVWWLPEGDDDLPIDYRTLRAVTIGRKHDAGLSSVEPELVAWDLRTGRMVFDPVKLPGVQGRTPILSPTGDRVAVLIGEGDVHLFDAATGKAGPKLTHPAAVIASAFHPDGSALATVARDAKLRVWDPATGKLLRPEIDANNTESWWSLAYSPDGRTLYYRSATGAGGWDPRTGNPVFTLEAKQAGNALAFSADGLHFAALDYEGVHLRYRDGGFRALPFLPHGGPVSATFSPDGRFLLTSGNGVRVWDLAAARRAARPFQPPAAVAVRDWSLSPAGDRAVSIDADGWVRVYDARTGELATPAFRPPGDWRTAELSPDGKLVITIGWAAGGTSAPSPAELAGRMCGGLGDVNYLWNVPRDVGVWDAATGRAVVPPLRHRAINRVLVSPDGRSLLVTGHVMDYTGRVPLTGGNEFTELSRWDLSTGELARPVVRQSGRVEPVAWTKDGSELLFLVSAGMPDGSEAVSAQFWDAEDLFAKTLKPDGFTLGPPQARVVQAALGADETRVLTVSEAGEAHVWHAATGQLVAGPFRHTSGRVGQKPALSMASFSPDGRRLVTTTGVDYGSEGEARVWDIETGRPVTPVLRAPAWMRYATFSPDGRLLATLDSGPELWELRVWDAETGMAVTPPLTVPVQALGTANSQFRDLFGRPRFTPDGQRILVPSKHGLSVIDLIAERRSAAELEPLARILSGNEMDAAGGFQPLSEAAAVEARDRWRQLTPGPRTGPDATYAGRQARRALTAENWPAADRWLSEVLKTVPGDSWALASRALARENLSRLAESSADWDAVIRIADGPTARSHRGNVLARLGRFPEAAADFAAAWTAAGSEKDGAQLALARWAAGDRAGYRQVCEQLRDRRHEYAGSNEGLSIAALACGLDPESAEMVRPFIPLLEGLAEVDSSATDLLRPLALSYVRTGQPEKVAPRLTHLSASYEPYCAHWQVLLLAMPMAERLPPWGAVGRLLLEKAVDRWWETNRGTMDWTEHIIVEELRKERR